MSTSAISPVRPMIAPAKGGSKKNSREFREKGRTKSSRRVESISAQMLRHLDLLFTKEDPVVIESAAQLRTTTIELLEERTIRPRPSGKNYVGRSEREATHALACKVATFMVKNELIELVELFDVSDAGARRGKQKEPFYALRPSKRGHQLIGTSKRREAHAAQHAARRESTRRRAA